MARPANFDPVDARPRACGTAAADYSQRLDANELLRSRPRAKGGGWRGAPKNNAGSSDPAPRADFFTLEERKRMRARAIVCSPRLVKFRGIVNRNRSGSCRASRRRVTDKRRCAALLQRVYREAITDIPNSTSSPLWERRRADLSGHSPFVIAHRRPSPLNIFVDLCIPR